MKYRKLPVVIDAMQFTNENKETVFHWITCNHYAELDGPDEVIKIETLEGDMIVRKGDWVIRGVNGEFYPCKPDIFEKTYEKVEW